MLIYLLRRVLYALPIMLGVALVCFALVHIAPGDPLVSILPPDASAEMQAQLRELYGFNRPLPVQFAGWVWRAVHGDLGTSIASGRPVSSEVMRAVGNTLMLAAAATLIGFFFGALFGFVAGYFQNSWVDKAASLLSVLGVSVPHYWLGMVLVIIFSSQLMWLPASGAGPGGSGEWRWDLEHIQFLILPAITMSVIPMGIVARTIRALVADILNQEFIVGLRAKGLKHLGVFAHVVKNAAPTALAVMGLQLGYLLGGSILIETVFSWPGTGFLLNSAIFQRDLPLLQGTILVLAMFFVVLNLIVDVVQTLLDPRITRAPDSNARTMNMLNVAVDPAKVPALRFERSAGYWETVLRRFTRDKLAVFAAVVILILLALALFGPWLAPSDPYATSMLRRLKPIGFEGHPLGTDELGRDMLTRLMVGTKLSLFMGITPVVMAFVIGSVLGIVAGYAGGAVNTVIMRTVDVFYAFPSVLLAIALSGALGAGITNSLISLTIVFIPPIARVAESVTTQVRNRDYVEAARASGASAFTIVRVHVLGNVLSPIFVYATSLIAVAMILASGLSFLGLGVRPPEPEWGLMLNTLRTAIYVQPWVAALPGAMIFVTSIAFNLLSDGLRAAMDIKG